jgi:hypothetical protein
MFTKLRIARRVRSICSSSHTKSRTICQEGSMVTALAIHIQTLDYCSTCQMPDCACFVGSSLSEGSNQVLTQTVSTVPHYAVLMIYLMKYQTVPHYAMLMI